MSQVLTEQYTLEYPSPGFHSASIDLASEDEAMMLNHRVRVYRLVVDLHNASFPSDAEYNNGTYYIGHGEQSGGWAAQVDAVPWFADERDICTLRDMKFVNASGLSAIFQFERDDGMGPLIRLNFGTDIQVGLTDGVPSSWTLGLDFGSFNLFSGSTGAVQLAAAYLEINGHAVNLYEPEFFPTTTGSITVTPVEWWPYAPTGGGAAIFDTTDGSQISANVLNG